MYKTSKIVVVKVVVINLVFTFILCKLGYESKELFTSKARVVGSSPTRGTLLKKDALYSVGNRSSTKIFPLGK